MNNFGSQELFCILLIIVVFVLIYKLIGETHHLAIVDRKESKIENYGGPIRKVRKIPMSDCYNMCDRWVKRCALWDPYGESDQCQRSGESCRLECQYSNALRM
jgi:hypothetical protein